jgi:hypothetical protein
VGWKWYTGVVLRAVVCLGLLSGSALADEPKARRIEVKVDETVEVEVGVLIGFQCDQPKLIDGKLTTRLKKDGVVNVFSVKGVTAGTTMCRVGSHTLGAFQLFEVVVREAGSRR